MTDVPAARIIRQVRAAIHGDPMLDVARLAVALDNVDRDYERGWTPVHYARAIAAEYDRVTPPSSPRAGEPADALAAMKPEDDWSDKFYAALAALWRVVKGTEIPAMGTAPHVVMAQLIEDVAWRTGEAEGGVPYRVRRCVTHHACDCAEWRLLTYEKALREITKTVYSDDAPLDSPSYSSLHLQAVGIARAALASPEPDEEAR
jgi:hypothetical protein